MIKRPKHINRSGIPIEGGREHRTKQFRVNKREINKKTRGQRRNPVMKMSESLSLKTCMHSRISNTITAAAGHQFQ